jgi:hypothetical protein
LQRGVKTLDILTPLCNNPPEMFLLPGMRAFLHTIAAVSLLAGASPAQTTRSYPVVALQGEAAPSISPTATYGIVGIQPRIGPNGHIVFGSSVTNGTGNYAILTGLPGAIAKLAVSNDPTPGRPGETLDIFNTSSSAPNWICEDGNAAFMTKTQPSGDNGIWMGKPGNLQAVAIANHAAPGIPDATFADASSFLFQTNGAGHLALRGFLQGPGITSSNDSAVWVGKVGDLSLVAREGSPAANLGPGVIFNDFTFSTFSLNSHGQLCLVAGVSTHPLTANTSLFLGNRNGLTKILQKGEAIAGFPGLSWDALLKPHHNDDGAFLIDSTPIPGGKRSLFTRANNGTVTRIAEETAIAPGAGSQTWANFFSSDPSLAGNNQAVFGAGLNPGANSDRDGIWIVSNGSPRLVAKKGDAAPGLVGQTFVSFTSDNQAPAVNKHGMVVFQGATNTGVNGIWRWHNGDLRLLLAVGDFLQIGPGDTRRVLSFSVKLGSGGQSGVPSGFNDRGQLVLRATFNTGALGTAIILINDILDPDGDGIDSLLEEAFGGNPEDPTDGNRQNVRLRKTGNDMKVVFPRRTDASFQYVVQTSGGFDPWSDLDVVPQLSPDQSGLLPGTERVEVPIPSGEVRLFSRLRVTRLAP